MTLSGRHRGDHAVGCRSDWRGFLRGKQSGVQPGRAGGLEEVGQLPLSV